MIYPDNFENKIEFDAVRRMLKEYTLCRLGEERVDDMQFMTDFKAINTRLDEVVEFVRILQLEQNFPSDYYYDVREPLQRIRISGMYMGEEELFSLRRSLETIGRMLSLLRKQGDGSESGEDNPLYPNLRRLAGDIDVLPSLLRAIDAIIDKFHFVVKGGKIVEAHAEKGEEALRAAIAVDEGAAYFGEVALVPYDSPISNQKILFYNTLFDENAACHIAFGEAYPCLENGETMSREELSKHGLNNSITHVDFMIGTPDLSITGTTEDGREIPIFVDGNFVF